MVIKIPRTPRQRTGEPWAKRAVHRFVGLSLPAAFIFSWWLVTKMNWVSPLVLPSPQAVLETLVQVLQNGYRGNSLLYHLGISLRRLSVGFGIALAAGAPLGLFMGHRKLIRRLFHPVIELIRPLPPLGYYAVLVLWFGIYETSKVALLFLAAFPPIVLATLDAVQRIPVSWVWSARSMGMSSWQLYRYVLLPASLPGVFTGIRVGLGFAFTTLVAAEMVAAHAGIGWMVLDAGRYLRNDVIFMGNVLLALTAYCLDRGVLFLRSRLIPWAIHDLDSSSS